MPDVFGILFSLPTESVTVRAVVGSLAAVAAATVLLRALLQAPRARILGALLPIGALVGAVVASWDQLLLPTLMTTSSAEDALGPFLVRDTYLRFAPVTWPLLSTWGVITGLRVVRRSLVVRRMRALTAQSVTSHDTRVRWLLLRVAADLRVDPPPVVMVEECPGAAALVGVRHPVLAMDADVVDRLDDHELEGVLAHELAHIRRRDNLLALLVGLIRDVFFFVPGGRWVTRRLCGEREVAADQLAVTATGRPGALASGLLKAIDVTHPRSACGFAAPLAAVERVERLTSEGWRSKPLRTAAEVLAVATVLALSVLASVRVPALVAEQAEEGWGRDALAVLWTWPTTAGTATPEATAFDVYHRSNTADQAASPDTTRTRSPGQMLHPAVLGGEPRAQSAGRVGSEQLARREAEALRDWRARAVLTGDDGTGVYWLYELRQH